MACRHFAKGRWVLVLLLTARSDVVIAAPAPAAVDAALATKVLVSVTSDRNKDAIESFLNRELRSLSGVRLVGNAASDRPDYELQVVEVEAGGLHAMSAIVVGFVSPLAIAMACELGATGHVTVPSTADAGLKSLQFGTSALKLMENVGTVSLHRLVTGVDLKERCQNIVASFDSQILEPYRKTLEGVLRPPAQRQP